MTNDSIEKRQYNATSPTANNGWVDVDGQVLDVKT